MSSAVEKYSGKVTPVGNPKGIRLDAAFFKAHPEFEGEVRATVLADGQVLLSARSSGKKTKAGEKDDPVLLGFLKAQMATQPERITAADRAQLCRYSGQWNACCGEEAEDSREASDSVASIGSRLLPNRPPQYFC